MKKVQKDLEDSILVNNSKYDELINQLESKTEDNKKEIDVLNTRFEEVREEQTKFLEEEKENLNNLKEELSNSITETIDEKIEKNNANYNSIMLEQNLKNFKEISDLRKNYKDLENSIKENISNTVYASVNENNSKYDELINQLGVISYSSASIFMNWLNTKTGGNYNIYREIAYSSSSLTSEERLTGITSKYGLGDNMF
ncbi:hypothetical protein [Brachyspira hampsonii]|uniref:hypothetical protein n=1 Tax=Brachyspira hampsonii TaxID=1287055 RepID=UPI00210AFA17|nr:hypothetical protein [Brachyspira hampsonii]